MPWIDPVVAEVRQTRESLSAALDFDVRAIFADLRARQAKLGDRLVSVQPFGDEDEQPLSGEARSAARTR